MCFNNDYSNVKFKKIGGCFYVFFMFLNVYQLQVLGDFMRWKKLIINYVGGLGI